MCVCANIKKTQKQNKNITVYAWLVVGILIFYRIVSCILIVWVEKYNKSIREIAKKVCLQFCDVLIYYECYKAYKKRSQKPSASMFQIRRLETYCESCLYTLFLCFFFLHLCVCVCVCVCVVCFCFGVFCFVVVQNVLFFWNASIYFFFETKCTVAKWKNSVENLFEKQKSHIENGRNFIQRKKKMTDTHGLLVLFFVLRQMRNTNQKKKTKKQK